MKSTIFDTMKTSLKRLEDKDIFRVLFESAGEGLVLVDQSGTIVMTNPRAEEMFLYKEDELIGEKIEVLIPESYRSRHTQHRDKYNNNPHKRSMGIGMDLSGRRKDGSTFPVEVSLNYFHADEGTIVMALITDVTERKKAEKALQQLNMELESRINERTQELAGAIHELEYTNKSLEKAEEDVRKALETEKELSELKSRFISTASHEFRTPLATILSSGSLIGKYNKPEDQDKKQKHIERIKSSVNNLKEILNDFLSLERLEAGKIDQHPISFDLKQFLSDFADEMQTIAKQGQKIRYVHEASESIVLLDDKFLRNIFHNLVSNAIKFSDEGKEIIITSNIGPGGIRISVKDNGIGISKEDQKHLFERFFRAKNATNIQGTGLGLNIIKKYLELMDGRIEFQSEIGDGTTFIITFQKKI